MRLLEPAFRSSRRCALLILLVLASPGCQGAAIKANQLQLEQQQVELDQLKQQVQALKNQSPPRYSAATSGACDENLMREASRKGGERFAAGDFTRALPYYQDALSACPQNARAHLNLARTYEAQGDTDDARAQYQAAESSSDGDSSIRNQARDALARLKP